MALIAPDNKLEYLEACRLAPDVVASETDPLAFLRTERMNPWAAATRLVLYWKHRRELFGEKWLRPILDTSGQGALGETDVEWLRAGVVAMRKNPAIVYVDMNKAPQTQGLSMFPARMSFFLCALSGSDESIRNEGVYIVNRLAPTIHFNNKKKHGRVWEISRNALPVRLRKVFLLKPADSIFTESLIRTCFSLMGMSIQFFLGSAPEFLFESDRTQSVRKFLSAGVPADCLPFCLGETSEGNVLSIKASEDPVAPLPPSGESEERQRKKRGRPPKTDVETALEEVRENAQGHEDFLRRRNAFYSRRLYQRKKEEIAGVEEQVNSLKEEQRRLKDEHERLSELLSQAQMTVAHNTSTVPMADFAS